MQKNTILHVFLYDEIEEIHLDTKYNSDYNELMKVVDKINSLSNRLIPVDIKIHNGYVEICVFRNKEYPFVYHWHTFIKYDRDEYTLIDAIYESVFDFVKWYNDNKELFTEGEQYCSPSSVIFENKGSIKHYKFFTKRDFNELKEFICDAFGCTVDALNSRTRKREVAIARQLFLTIVHFDGYTLGFAGSLVGRDHATTFHSRKVIKTIIDAPYDKYHENVMYVLDKLNIKDLKL